MKQKIWYFQKPKKCEVHVNQTHRKAEETFEFKLTKPRETFLFNPPISIEGCWTIGLPSLEFYNSIFNVIHENNKFELYTDTFEEFPFKELKRELEELKFQIFHTNIYRMK